MPMRRRDFICASTAWLLASAARPRLLARTGRAGGAAGASASLFFAPERIEALRRRIERDPATRTRWNRFLQRAEELLRLPALRGVVAGTPPVSAEKYALAGRDLRQMAFTLGLAWRVTGDRHYAEPLRAALLHSAAHPDWTMDSTGGRTPPWRADLWTAVFTVSCAAGRDALADFLTPAERVEIGRAVRERGVEPLLADWVLPEQRIHALDSMGHNWWCVCVAAAGVGALSLLEEEPRASGWIHAVDTALDGFFAYEGQILQNKPRTFDRAGAFYEGVHYADYALAEYLTYRLARRHVRPDSPLASIPALDRAVEFFVHASYPTSAGLRSLDFGDSTATDHAGRSVRLLALQGCQPELAAWYLQRADPDAGDPLELLHESAPARPARSALPTAILYGDIGWAMLRNAWSDDATLLAVRCGDTWNHAHADAASFVLWHRGRPLLTDSGKCAYSRQEYTAYYRQSRAHNVVLFNGHGQPLEDVQDRGAKFPGRLHDLIDGLGLKYLYADATGPMARYLSRHYRHWLWLDDGVILIFDDLRAHEPGRFDWLLHYAGEARGEGASVIVEHAPASVQVRMLHPPEPLRREETGLAPDDPDTPRRYLSWSTREAAREQKFIVALLPDGAGPRPRVDPLDRPGVLGVRVTTETETTDVWLNLAADGRRMHLNSNLQLEGWETDAYLLALTRPVDQPAATVETVTRIFMVAASYLRRDGRVWWSSASKATAAVRLGDEIEVLLHGQPTVEATVGRSQVVRGLRVNGAACPFEVVPDLAAIRFCVTTEPAQSFGPAPALPSQ